VDLDVQLYRCALVAKPSWLVHMRVGSLQLYDYQRTAARKQHHAQRLTVSAFDRNTDLEGSPGREHGGVHARDPHQL